jgi:aspartyl-tRNA(Asn)/glutamyl-tRNA(Gln) amidotransferase subunit B
VEPAQVAELLGMVASGEITGKQAKNVQGAMLGTFRSPREIVRDLGLTVVSDASALRPVCEQLIAENPKQAEAVRAGKRAVLGFFVGQVMKRTQGQADPKLVSELLLELLGLEK